MKSKILSLPNKYLPSLDGLRCFSILYVIVAHFNEYNPAIRSERLAKFFGGGLFGVQVFFVISGFIITTLLLNEQASTGSISLGRFYLRRVLRILPLAYSFLIVLLLLNACWHLAIQPISFVASFAFLKNIGLPADWYTSHYWSLSVEEQYYLIFPFLLTRGLKPYIKICLSFIALYFCKNILEHFSVLPERGGIQPIWDVLLSSYMLSILIGSLTAILFFLKRDRLRSLSGNPYLVSLIEIAALGLALYLFAYPKLFGFTYFVASCLIALALLLLVSLPYGPLYRLLNTRPAVFIGKLSFSLYIWQQLFTAHQPWAHWFKFGGSILPNLVGLTAAAMISYYVVERPFLRLRSRFREKPIPAPAPATASTSSI